MTREHSNPNIIIHPRCHACQQVVAGAHDIHTHGESLLLCRDAIACRARMLRTKRGNARPLAAWSEGREFGGEA